MLLWGVRLLPAGLIRCCRDISAHTLTQLPCSGNLPPPHHHHHHHHHLHHITCSLTRWSYVGKASELGARFCCSFQPRRQLQLRDLGPHLLRTEFDFTGVLVWAGPVMPDGEVHSKCVYAR
jgi:hypothetical protein